MEFFWLIFLSFLAMQSSKGKSLGFVFILNPLQPSVAYVYSLKISELLGFLMLSGGIDKQHWAVMK